MSYVVSVYTVILPVYGKQILLTLDRMDNSKNPNLREIRHDLVALACMSLCAQK